MADCVFSTLGRFLAAVLAVYLNTYLQAHRLDKGFHGRDYRPGAYLRTHAAHDQNWG